MAQQSMSEMEAPSRYLLVAVLGVWIGFLGLMAIITLDDPFPTMPGAVAVISGLMIALFGLNKAIRDRPAGIA